MEAYIFPSLTFLFLIGVAFALLSKRIYAEINENNESEFKF